MKNEQLSEERAVARFVADWDERVKAALNQKNGLGESLDPRVRDRAGEKARGTFTAELIPAKTFARRGAAEWKPFAVHGGWGRVPRGKVWVFTWANLLAGGFAVGVDAATGETLVVIVWPEG